MESSTRTLFFSPFLWFDVPRGSTIPSLPYWLQRHIVACPEMGAFGAYKGLRTLLLDSMVLPLAKLAWNQTKWVAESHARSKAFWSLCQLFRGCRVFLHCFYGEVSWSNRRELSWVEKSLQQQQRLRTLPSLPKSLQAHQCCPNTTDKGKLKNHFHNACKLSIPQEP